MPTQKKRGSLKAFKAKRTYWPSVPNVVETNPCFFGQWKEAFSYWTSSNMEYDNENVELAKTYMNRCNNILGNLKEEIRNRWL